MTNEQGKAFTQRKTFSRETSVSEDIQAEPAIIWALLTNASDFPRWNSTIVSIEGRIEKGEKIVLRSTLDPKRQFRLTVKEFLPEQQLAWGDAMGKRVYTLQRTGDGKTRFSMREKIGGPLFPLFARMIPSFDESFEKFTACLKKEAERITNTK